MDPNPPNHSEFQVTNSHFSTMLPCFLAHLPIFYLKNTTILDGKLQISDGAKTQKSLSSTNKTPVVVDAAWMLSIRPKLADLSLGLALDAIHQPGQVEASKPGIIKGVEFTEF